jgi:septation ring formation regulator EzrA
MSKVHADIEALKALRDALPIFINEQRDAMKMVAREIDRTLELLDQAEWHWRSEILSCTSSLIECVPDVLDELDEGADSLQRAGYYLDDLTSKNTVVRKICGVLPMP